jgi:enoyl ACP reductase
MDSQRSEHSHGSRIGTQAKRAPAPGALLADKRLLITGVLTRHSIAFAAAKRAQELGAEVALTGFGRTRRMTERAAAALPKPAPVLELDVGKEEDLGQLAHELGERWPHLDGLLHAIAYAPADALGGNFLNTPAASAVAAFQTSAYSLAALVRVLAPLLARAPRGSSVLALHFDSERAWPAYDWMGVAKAALVAVARYLARDLGPEGVRVNLLAAGPLETPAASGIPGFGELASAWSGGAPLGWRADDPDPVADAICLLLSDLARAISGEVVHADGGLHALALAGADGRSSRPA